MVKLIRNLGGAVAGVAAVLVLCSGLSFSQQPGPGPVPPQAVTVTLSGDVAGSGTTAITTTIQPNAVPNAKLAPMAANGFKANNTGGSANPQDLTPAQATALLNDCSGLLKGEVPTPPNNTTTFLRGDCTFAGAPVTSVFGRSSSVAAAAGDYTASQIYAFPITPQGRLTLTTATPVMTTTVSGATTILYTPYLGALIPIYDGTRFTPALFSELSNVTTASSTGNAGPAAVAASSNYDLFVWSNAGTPTLTRSPLWSGNATRANTLDRINGILVNHSAITNGPGADLGTYVGTVHSNGSSQIDYIFGASASGGTAASLQVWNAYNRVLTGTTVTDSGTSYTYSAATIRQARGSAGNQIGFVVGLQEDAVQFSETAQGVPVNTATAVMSWGVGFDSTTVFSIAQSINGEDVSTATVASGISNSGIWAAGLGTHTLSANENSDGTNANTFDRNSVNALMALIRN